MTENPDESLEKKPDSNENESSNPQPAETPSSIPQEAAAPGEEGTATATDGEGLPEWEPLTPELVEDEAIRGDFVIRWVVVGLALLLGISQITETRTLVHIKTGQYLMEHGFLPPSNDVFSSTANDHRWVNLSWLFDIITSGIYSISGGIGLSLLQGVIACAAFALLVHALRPHIRTWWGSICAVMALLACYLQFTVQPELITLLGLAFVLWTLVQSEEPGKSTLLWRIVPAIWIWAQCDPHAWMGWFLLVLWTVGELFSRESVRDGDRGLLAKVTLASLIAVAIHPFLWESWLAPVRMYLTDYPAMRAAYPNPSSADLLGYFPIWHEGFWISINHRTIAGLFLIVATLVTLSLNAQRLRWSHVFAFAGFNLLAMVTTHELAAASFVNCVICTLNAQAWYKQRFGQVYSIDWRELLFSRGGRAVTVLSFFVLAWLILSGRIDGPAGKRTGVGFEAYLSNAMQDYRSLSGWLVDDRPFNFSIRQGDLMIWSGQKCFVDSRVGLYFGPDETSIMNIHKATRVALQKPRKGMPGSGKSSVWKETFAKYKIRQAWPRLHGFAPAPDYVTFYDLLESSEFKLTELNSAVAVFVRTDPSDETAVAYLREHTYEPVNIAFRRDAVQEDEGPRDFAKPATTYDNIFSLRRPSAPRDVLSAKHHERLAMQLAALTKGAGALTPPPCAAALIAVRQANEGLRLDPNCLEGYKALGQLYSYLGQVEIAIANNAKESIPNRLRYFQTVAALQQALLLAPEDSMVIRQLLMQYQRTGRVDVQLELVRKLLKQHVDSRSENEADQQEQEKLYEVSNLLEEQVNRIDSSIANYLGSGTDRLQVANFAYQAGGLLIPIKTLEEDAIYLTQNPAAKLTLASWLMEAGRGREASEMLESLQALARQGGNAAIADTAAISAMLTGNYGRAIQLWKDNLQSSTEANLQQTLSTLPFTTLNPFWTGPDSYPSATVASSVQLLRGLRIEGAEIQFQIAVAQMESGTVKDALKTLKQALEANSISPYSPVFRFYVECLSGEKIEDDPDDADVEEFEDLAPPAESAKEEKTESGADPKPATDTPEAQPKAESKSDEQPKPDGEPKP